MTALVYFGKFCFWHIEDGRFKGFHGPDHVVELIWTLYLLCHEEG